MANTKITNITAEEIKDSRGNPTLSVTVETEGGQGTFDVPSGASTGEAEAYELRDIDGGMSQAIENINTKILPEITGMDGSDQNAVDERMIEIDGTPDKHTVGGNAMIGVSVAVSKAVAQTLDIPLYEHLRDLNTANGDSEVPRLFVNLINGGEHADTELEFQEFHIIPQTDDVDLAYNTANNVRDVLGDVIKEFTEEDMLDIGDEGGYSSPSITSNKTALSLLTQAIEKSSSDIPVSLGLDVAANSFCVNDRYYVDGQQYSGRDFHRYYDDLMTDFELFSIEDPFHESSENRFHELHLRYSELIVIGDDLTTTNPSILKHQIDQDTINALIIKPNQVGTLTETLKTISLAHENNIKCIVSHRSGETMDDFIADLVIGCGCFGLKAGAPQKPEREAKYKRVREIVRNS